MPRAPWYLQFWKKPLGLDGQQHYALVSVCWSLCDARATCDVPDDFLIREVTHISPFWIACGEPKLFRFDQLPGREVAVR